MDGAGRGRFVGDGAGRLPAGALGAGCLRHPVRLGAHPEPGPVRVRLPVAAEAYVGALGGQKAADRVGRDGGPDLAGVHEERTLPGEGIPVPVPLPLLPHPVHQVAVGGGAGGGVEREVQETGAGDLDTGDSGAPASRSRRISATSRAARPAGPASWRATALA